MPLKPATEVVCLLHRQNEQWLAFVMYKDVPKRGGAVVFVKSRYVQDIALSGKHGMEESLEVDFQTSYWWQYRKHSLRYAGG
jgi:hypothetical protein